ncbi:haloacid dehalogenase superfamily, subfamily IA, variant 3 with third motif having DD or ED [Lentzea xinjiangensis]|uniref:Haloacid dehalogenase superfamily, subfamily IA, variant 3 with third motif having DD or ED n=1 Tax=Lentzea xinjiangensis TaxID=402600 RepID=A0A1H9R772_9PSEU|nr:HAD family phosphatase [Lentzea xinjiangensis]SER68572.1 haloacid dehalogenase superfamily, subfamily IA, variant 3 with third motif having DD or ED [Lentzea xinjiangensis]
MSDLQAVLWDMDGTLLDSEKLWDIPLFEYAEKLGGVLSQETRERMVGSNVPTTMRLLFGDVGIEPTEADMADGAAWILRRTEEVFRAGLPWRPGAQEALKAVRASGVPMALVTSTERGLTEVALDTIGRDLFDVTVCGDEVDGLNKPLPEPYLKAARLLGVDAARCVAVEDSPTGVAAAVAAGCTVLVVPCDVEVPPGERRIFRDSLAGVDLDVLKAL